MTMPGKTVGLLRPALLVCIVVPLIFGCGGNSGGGGCQGTACALPIGIQDETRFLELPGKSGGLSFQQPDGPSGRYFAAMAYDPVRDDFVMFGGQTATGTSGETWILERKVGQNDVSSSRWRQVRPAHNPPPRRAAAMAYDPSHQVVLMYGGLVPDAGEGSEASDTWAWNGADWTQLANDSTMGIRTGAKMVTAGSGVLLFGGNDGNLRYFADAWTWNGSTWVRVDREPAPPGRGSAAAFWDDKTASLLVFGGYGLRADAGPGNLGIPLADAWQLQAGKWTRLTDGPPALTLPYAYPSPDGSGFLVSGIACPKDANDLWEWQTGLHSWLHVGSTYHLWGAAAAGDDHGLIVEFGGSNEPAC